MNTEIITPLLEALIIEHEEVSSPERLVINTLLFDGFSGYCRYQIRRPMTVPVAAAVEFHCNEFAEIQPLWLRIL